MAVKTDVVTEALDSLRIGPENRAYPTEVVPFRITVNVTFKSLVKIDQPEVRGALGKPSDSIRTVKFALLYC